MSSGKTHDQVNSMATLAILGAGIATARLDLLACATGLLIGTIWLSPDLDLARSNPSSRLGIVKLLFKPYRLFCGHHRSIISHSPILSTIIRFVYVAIIPMLIAVMLGHQGTLRLILNHPLFLWFYLGLEISTNLHLFLDWQYSFRKHL